MATACAGGGVLQWWTSGNLNTRKRIELNGCRSRGFLVGTTPIAKPTKNASLLIGPRTGRKMRKTFPVSPVMEWQDCRYEFTDLFLELDLDHDKSDLLSDLGFLIRRFFF